MKKFLLAGVALAFIGSAARAADLPINAPYQAAPIPVYSWTGVYLGANIGYSWGQSKFDATLAGVATVSHSERMNGVIGGGQFGFNYQFGMWVLGLETDIQARLYPGQPSIRYGHHRPQARLVRHVARTPGLPGNAEHLALRDGRCRIR